MWEGFNPFLRASSPEKFNLTGRTEGQGLAWQECSTREGKHATQAFIHVNESKLDVKEFYGLCKVVKRSHAIKVLYLFPCTVLQKEKADVFSTIDASSHECRFAGSGTGSIHVGSLFTQQTDNL